MEIIQKIKKNNTVIFCFLAFIAYNVLKYIMMAPYRFIIAENYTGSNTQYFIAEFILMIEAVILAFIVKQMYIFKFTGKAFIKSQWSGAYFYFLAAILIPINISEAIEQGKSLKATHEIIIFFLFVLLVGLAEEAVFRGIIADSLFTNKCNSVKSTYLCILLSGLIFGFAHMSNYFSGQSLNSTINQVIATTMLGIILGAIYFKHRSLYGVALLHTVLDMSNMFGRGLFVGGGVADDLNANMDFITQFIQTMRSQIPYLIVAFIILRPSVVKKILKLQEENVEKSIAA